jgi:hypothetical protein
MGGKLTVRLKFEALRGELGAAITSRATEKTCWIVEEVMRALAMPKR